MPISSPQLTATFSERPTADGVERSPGSKAMALNEHMSESRVKSVFRVRQGSGKGVHMGKMGPRACCLSQHCSALRPVPCMPSKPLQCCAGIQDQFVKGCVNEEPPECKTGRLTAALLALKPSCLGQH